MKDIYNYSIVKLRKAGLKIYQEAMEVWISLTGLSHVQAHGPWISFPPPLLSNIPPFKIFIIIRFSSFDNISRRHTS